jgi:hypothetical protein
MPPKKANIAPKSKVKMNCLIEVIGENFTFVERWNVFIEN